MTSFVLVFHTIDDPNWRKRGKHRSEYFLFEIGFFFSLHVRIKFLSEKIFGSNFQFQDFYYQLEKESTGIKFGNINLKKYSINNVLLL
jgi:hypothetical protein